MEMRYGGFVFDPTHYSKVYVCGDRLIMIDEAMKPISLTEEDLKEAMAFITTIDGHAWVIKGKTLQEWSLDEGKMINSFGGPEIFGQGVC